VDARHSSQAAAAAGDDDTALEPAVEAVEIRGGVQVDMKTRED
jgi:hypothetical protein